MIRAIAFDFGGTLFSTAKMGLFTPEMTNVFLESVTRELECSQETAEQIFKAYTTVWKSRRARGGELPERELSSLNLLQLALSEVDTTLPEAQLIKILNAFHSEESKQFAPLPNVVQSLPKLAEAGYRLCIVSNNPWSESIRASLRHHKIESLFERIIVSCDVGFRKPHRQIFDELLRQLDIPASEILFVGDSFTHDTEMPKKLGMRTCLVDLDGTNKNGQTVRASDADIFLTQFDQLISAVSVLE